MLVTFFPVFKSDGVHAPAYAMFGHPSSPPERHGLHKHATCLASTIASLPVDLMWKNNCVPLIVTP